MTPRRFKCIRSILARRQPDLSVVLDNVHKPHNLSAIIRSADAVGVLQVHGVWPDTRSRPTNHISGGTRKWVDVQSHRTLEGAIDHLHRRGFTVYAAHPSSRARDFRAFDYTVPCAVLMGAELHGLSEKGRKLADHHLTIPMCGMVPSLNVSVAAAVILYEAQRQRAASGLYDTVRLEPAEYARTLFEWVHPAVARFCRAHRRPYPDMDEQGEIIGFDGPRATALSGPEQQDF